MINVFQAVALFLVPLGISMFLCRFIALVNEKERRVKTKEPQPAGELPK